VYFWRIMCARTQAILIMQNSHNIPAPALLRRIGLTPGKKSLVFFISLVAITIPMEHAYSSFAVICFVLFSLLSARRSTFSFTTAMALPMALYALMALSLLWTHDLKVSATALAKESALLFLPLAFCFNRNLTHRSLTAVLKNFSLAMCLFGIYLVGRALVRYVLVGNPAVFFYNELASEKISIYLATFFSLALFFFLVQKKKTYWGYVATIFMLCMVMLLSKKSIILADVAIICLYYLFYSGLLKKTRWMLIGLFCVAGGGFIFFGNLTEGWQFLNKPEDGKHIVSVQEALSKPVFDTTDYFDGVSFRAYRVRVLAELSREGSFALTGSGLNTSGIQVTQIAHKHNTLHRGWEIVPYNKLNFHNQFMEAYADLGIVGLVLVVAMVLYSLVRAIKTKYFIHIAFAILMISLFLTESFLWRQKGVVFFTLFYSLFNNLKPSGLIKHSK